MRARRNIACRRPPSGRFRRGSRRNVHRWSVETGLYRAVTRAWRRPKCDRPGRDENGRGDASGAAHLMRVSVRGSFTPSMVNSIASPTCRPVPATLWPSIGPVVSANASSTTFPAVMLADCFPTISRPVMRCPLTTRSSTSGCPDTVVPCHRPSQTFAMFWPAASATAKLAAERAKRHVDARGDGTGREEECDRRDWQSGFHVDTFLFRGHRIEHVCAGKPARLPGRETCRIESCTSRATGRRCASREIDQVVETN